MGPKSRRGTPGWGERKIPPCRFCKIKNCFFDLKTILSPLRGYANSNLLVKTHAVLYPTWNKTLRTHELIRTDLSPSPKLSLSTKIRRPPELREPKINGSAKLPNSGSILKKTGKTLNPLHPKNKNYRFQTIGCQDGDGRGGLRTQIR